MLSPKIFMFLLLPKVPFPGFLSHSNRILASSILRIIVIIISNAWKLEKIVQTIFQISAWKVSIKNIFVMKNLTCFRKTVETGGIRTCF